MESKIKKSVTIYLSDNVEVQGKALLHLCGSTMQSAQYRLGWGNISLNMSNTNGDYEFLPMNIDAASNFEPENSPELKVE